MLYRIQIAVAAVHSSAKCGTHLKCNDRDFSSPLTLLLPRRRLPRRCGRPFASLRPSVFLSETSTLILVVEIGFLRHRSRGTDGRTEKTDDDFDDEGGKKRRGGKETRSPDGRTDADLLFTRRRALHCPLSSQGMHTRSRLSFMRHK